MMVVRKRKGSWHIMKGQGRRKREATPSRRSKLFKGWSSQHLF
jgi:hypothetical protein